MLHEGTCYMCRSVFASPYCHLNSQRLATDMRVRLRGLCVFCKSRDFRDDRRNFDFQTRAYFVDSAGSRPCVGALVAAPDHARVRPCERHGAGIGAGWGRIDDDMVDRSHHSRRIDGGRGQSRCRVDDRQRRGRDRRAAGHDRPTSGFVGRDHRFGRGSRLEVQRTNAVTGNQIRVGASGLGTLNVEDGAEVAARELSMGSAANAGGIVKVSGPGAMLTTDRLINSSWASAGDNSGAITIDRGGRITTLNVTIGAAPADNRAMVAQTLISGANSLWANGQLFENGRSMTIQDGGRLTTGDAELGGNATTLATTYVSGAGSAFIATGTIRIGDLEQHNLSVANGANLSAREIILGGRSLGSGDSFGALTIGGRISINTFDEPSSVTAIAAGTVDPSTLISFTGTDGNLVFNHTDSGYRFTNKIAGDGAIYNLAGETILSGDLSGFVGTSTLGGVVVSGGRLVIESDFGTAANTSDGTRIYVNNGTLVVNGATGQITTSGGIQNYSSRVFVGGQPGSDPSIFGRLAGIGTVGTVRLYGFNTGGGIDGRQTCRYRARQQWRRYADRDGPARIWRQLDL